MAVNKGTAFLSLVSLGLVVTLAYLVKWNSDERVRLAAENRTLRFANAAIFERWPDIPPAEVDYIACRETEYWTLSPWYLTAAIRRQENGRTHRELGYHGKSQFISKNMSITHWQYGEAGRMASRKLWKWVQKDGKRWRSYIDYLASRYRGGSLQQQQLWARNVRILVKKEKARVPTKLSAMSASEIREAFKDGKANNTR